MFFEDTPIQGNRVLLEPIKVEHVQELITAVEDGEHWKLWYTNVPSPSRMEQYVHDTLAAKDEFAYVVRMKASNQIVGTTRLYNIDPVNRRAMIGYTWYSDSVRRTSVNTECKFLLLKVMFEVKQAIAVEFRTHADNYISRKAIERLGAKLDGILRSHQVMRNDTVRDTAVYSIISTEWEVVKQNLQDKLDSYNCD